jgi:hypothetical protein
MRRSAFGRTDLLHPYAENAYTPLAKAAGFVLNEISKLNF